MPQRLLKHLDLNQVDLLGFSIGGMVAQELALQEGDLIRRIIIAGSSPEAGVNPDPVIFERMNRHGGNVNDAINDFMFFFYDQLKQVNLLGWILYNEL